MAKSRTRPGDVVEIPTSKGLAYALYTHWNKEFGYLIQVLENLHRVRPKNIQEIFHGPISIVTFFPLQTAMRMGMVAVVGNIQIPDRLSKFPIFRAGFVSPATGKVSDWWFWDGEKEWRVGKITDKQKEMPIRAIWNDTMLIHRIESGWRSEKDVNT